MVWYQTSFALAMLAGATTLAKRKYHQNLISCYELLPKFARFFMHLHQRTIDQGCSIHMLQHLFSFLFDEFAMFRSWDVTSIIQVQDIQFSGIKFRHQRKKDLVIMFQPIFSSVSEKGILDFFGSELYE